MTPHERDPHAGSAPRTDPNADHGEPETLLNTVPLSRLIQVVRRHLRLVLGMAATAGAAAAGLAYAVGPVYSAVAVIRLSDPRRALTGGVVDDPAQADPRFADPLVSQAELLTSRRVAAAVVDSLPVLRLEARGFSPSLLGAVTVATADTAPTLELTFERDSFVVRGPAGARKVAYGGAAGFGEIGFTVQAAPEADRGTVAVLPREAAISRLIARLRVKRRLGTDIFDVAYSASDPYVARGVVNHTVDIFQTASAEAAQGQSRRRREFLESQLRVNDSLLAEARDALTAFNQAAGGIGSREVLLREQMGLAGLELQRQELQAERRTYQDLLESLRDSTTTDRALQTALSTPDVAVTPAVTQLSRQLFEFSMSRDSLTALSASHPDLARVNQMVDATEEKLLGAVQAGVRNAIGALDGRIAAMNDLRSRQRRLSATEGEEARLAERVDNLRRMSDELRMEYQKAGIAEAVTVGQVEIVDHAILPAKPVGLSLVERLALGMIVGLVLGAGGAFLAERLGRSIDRRVQVEQLGLSVLGVITRLDREASPKGARSKSADAVIEGFRGIRLAVANAHATPGPLVVTVTSPASGDGKSFVSSNLALAFARANHRTLLVDADLRRGALHRVLNLLRQPGLTDLLVGQVSRERVLQRTSYPGLDFMAGGSRRPDAPELLGSPSMAELVATLRSSYEAIVLDTPPLGAGVDAVMLGSLAGSLLIVLRLGRTDRELAEAKVESLQHLPVRLLGAVLNDVRDGSEYSAYAYYLDGYELPSEQPLWPLTAPQADGHRAARARETPPAGAPRRAERVGQPPGRGG